MRCEPTLQKKPPIPHIAPLAVRSSSLSPGRLDASVTAPALPVERPVAKPASGTGSRRPPTNPITPARNKPAGCKHGGSQIPATGAGSARANRQSKRLQTWTLCFTLLRYKTPAVRYKIPGLCISLPSWGSLPGFVGLRYKTSSQRSCPKS